MNPNPHNQVKYTHVLSWEKIDEFSHLTPEDRLNWLEEANEFVNTFVDPEARRIWREMNKGRIEQD